MARLVVREESRERIVELIDPTATLGRAVDNLICLTDKKSSRRHCQIEKVDQGYKLVDLESRNGTRVNNDYVNQRLLVSGDVIQIGEAQIAFEDGPVAAQPPTVTTSVPVKEPEGVKVQISVPVEPLLPQAPEPEPIVSGPEAPTVRANIPRTDRLQHKVTTAIDAPARFNAGAVRKQQEEQKVLRGFVIGGVLFFVAIVGAVIVNSIMSETVEQREARETIRRCEKMLQEAHDEADPKAALEKLKSAEAQLKRIPEKLSAEFKNAQEIDARINEEVNKREPALHAEEMREIEDLEKASRAAGKVEAIDKVLASLTDFRRRYPSMLGATAQRVATLEKDLKAKTSNSKDRGFNEGMAYIDSCVERSDYVGAVNEVERLLEVLKNDVRLRQEVVRKKDSVMDQLKKYRDEIFRRADGKAKSSDVAGARKDLEDLHQRLGAGGIKLLKDQCDLVMSKIAVLGKE